MRLLILSAFIACTLVACDQPAPGPTPPPTTEAAPAAATPAAPAETVVAKPPEGDCGDQSAVAPEERVANTPKWSLASEQDNFGFDVFRGDSEEGDFIKLNENPILGAGTTDETQKYQYRDDRIDPCREYWYYVESISTTGVREKMTPTFKAAAKRSAKAESAGQ